MSPEAAVSPRYEVSSFMRVNKADGSARFFRLEADPEFDRTRPAAADNPEFRQVEISAEEYEAAHAE